jgi:hypothetical protein
MKNTLYIGWNHIFQVKLWEYFATKKNIAKGIKVSIRMIYQNVF